jgi:hypothetical protein
MPALPGQRRGTQDHQLALVLFQFIITKNPLIPSWAWWHMSVVSAMQEADIRGSRSKANPGKNSRLYLDNKLKSKELGCSCK